MNDLLKYQNKWQINFNQKHKYIKNIINTYKLKV